MLLLSILFSVFLSSHVNANSARSGTCYINQVNTPAMPGPTLFAATNSQFSVAMNPSQIIFGATHTITVTRTTGTGGFRGLLLYLEDASNQRHGTLAAGGGVSAQPLSCNENTATASTLTHTISSAFTNPQTFTWTAPGSVTGPLTLQLCAYVSGVAWNVPTALVVQIATNQTTAPPLPTMSTMPAGSTVTPTNAGGGGGGGTGSCPAGSTLQASSTLGGDIDLTLIANCSAQRLTARITGPANNWFGIVFGPRMFTYDAIIYTMGSSGSAALFDYYITSQSQMGVIKDTIQNWTPNSPATTTGGRITLDYSRPWQTGDAQDRQFTASNLIIELNWAKGMSGSTTLAYHGRSNRGSAKVTFDLYKGSVGSTENPIPSANIVHAIFMFLGWGIVAPFGIWASKNRVLLAEYDSDLPMWWKIHRVAMPLAIIFMFAGLIQAIVMTIESGSGHFNSPHDIIGFTAIIIAVLQPLNAFFRPHAPKPGEDKEPRRFYWEILHKGLGGLAFLIALFAMLTGTLYLGVQALLIVYIVYVVLLVGAFLAGFCFSRGKGGIGASSTTTGGVEMR